MAIEIERKFLVNGEGWRSSVTASTLLQQGYLPGLVTASVRVRIAGDRAFLNIKSATLGTTRTEFEYAIPVPDAHDLLESLCEQPRIEKTRHNVPFGGHLWQVDEFFGDNAGLVVAEIELASVNESFAVPPWIGREVSSDTRYYNVNLVKKPYKSW